MSEKWTLGIVTVLAIAVSIAVCWYWRLDFITGGYGIHGGWGFEIFVGAFAAIYVPLALIRRARRRPGKDRTR